MIATAVPEATPPEARESEAPASRWRPGWLGKAGWYPLLILFGLNMTDELDRAAYFVLLPDIRDSLGLTNSGILAVVTLAGAAALLLAVPIAHLADRRNRVAIALIGATGHVGSAVAEALMRSGAPVTIVTRDEARAAARHSSVSTFIDCMPISPAAFSASSADAASNREAWALPVSSRPNTTRATASASGEASSITFGLRKRRRGLRRPLRDREW